MGDIDEDARALIGDGIIERMPTAEEKRQIIEAGLQVGGLEYTLRGVIEEYLPGLLTADESLFMAEGRAIDDAYHKKQRGNKKPPATKACPACAEQILFAAAKCKHCGHVMGSVIGGIAAPPPPAPASRLASAAPIVVKSHEGCFLRTLNLGCLILVIIAVMSILLIAGLLFS